MVNLVTWDVKPVVRYTIVRSERSKDAGSAQSIGQFDTPEEAQKISELLQRKEVEDAIAPLTKAR